MIGLSKMNVNFGISKCTTLVANPKNFIPSWYYENPIFMLGMNYQPNTNQCTYLEIPFKWIIELILISVKINCKNKLYG